MPADETQVADYVVYLADDAAGANKGASGGVSVVSVVAFAQAPDTAKGSNTHVVVYSRSTLVEQTTPVAALLSDALPLRPPCLSPIQI